MFYCICAVLRGSLLCISCGFSAVKINDELLLLLLLLQQLRTKLTSLTTRCPVRPSLSIADPGSEFRRHMMSAEHEPITGAPVGVPAPAAGVRGEDPLR